SAVVAKSDPVIIRPRFWPFHGTGPADPTCAQGSMLTALCVLTCVLAPAQPAGGSDWLVGPRLARGQELVYSGSYREEAMGKGVKFARSYRLETRILALEVSQSDANLAILTTLKLRPSHTPGGAAPEPSSVRLEMARMTPQGKLVLSSGQAPVVPL